jgi:hypothetical protein
MKGISNNRQEAILQLNDYFAELSAPLKAFPSLLYNTEMAKLNTQFQRGVRQDRQEKHFENYVQRIRTLRKVFLNEDSAITEQIYSKVHCYPYLTIERGSKESSIHLRGNLANYGHLDFCDILESRSINTLVCEFPIFSDGLLVDWLLDQQTISFDEAINSIGFAVLYYRVLSIAFKIDNQDKYIGSSMSEILTENGILTLVRIHKKGFFLAEEELDNNIPKLTLVRYLDE